MNYRKAHNSTLRPVSLKRQAAIADGTFKRKPRGAIKPKGTAVIERLLGEGLVTKAAHVDPKPRKRLKKRKGPSGEKEMFLRLFDERGGISEVSGSPLVPPPDGNGRENDLHWKAFLRQFSHILPKGTYRHLRLIDRNVMLKTASEHDAWETRKWELRNKPEWAHVFAREEELKKYLIEHGGFHRR